MFHNELSSGIGRGRGRGRGRLVQKVDYPNQERKRGPWVNHEKLTHQTTSSTYPNPSSQASESYQILQESGTRNEYEKISSKTPPLSSSNISTIKAQMSQIHSPQKQLGRGRLISGAQSKSDLPPPFDPTRPSGANISQQVLKNNYRQQLKNVRLQINNMPEISRSLPNNRFTACANNRNSVTSPRRGNKRPVTSPTASNGDRVTTSRSSDSSGAPREKYNKKTKSDTDSNDSKVVQNKESSLVNPELYQLKISENKSFAEQTEELISQLEQTDAERNKRLEVIEDVADLFSPHLPQVEPQIYGSTFTNIAFKTSDLDIFLYCPQGQPEYNFVLEKGKFMYKSHKFTNVVRVPRARVPVIKATHVETNVDVDISTMSGQAVYNSRLIKHLLSADNRIRPLAMLISLWAKLNTVTGHSRFTSYSIILLLIYYLQKVNPPILPPLKEILYSKYENDWPINFYNKPLGNQNNSSLAVLFKGFFEFYVNFDFEKVVISPYLGREIPTQHFNKNINELTDELKLYKNKLNENILPFMITYTMHLQDPIEHNVNTTKGVFVRLMRLFYRCCERFLNTCQDSVPQNNWLPLIIKQTPLKLVDEKKINILIHYPVNDESWFQNFIKDFKELLKIILIDIKEDKPEVNVISSNGKQKEIFYAEACYNVFNKKFRFPLRMYTSGIIPLNELKNQFEMVINRVKASVPLLKAKFILEEQDNGCVKVTIIDKNTTGLNSFLSLVNEFKRYCGKFLNDIISLRQSSSLQGDKPSESNVVVMDLDTESQERLNNSNNDINETVDTNKIKTEISKDNKDDSKTDESSK